MSKKAIDLFAGCGGLTLGLKQAGFQVVSAIEINPFFCETYRLNHPEVKILCKDILSVDLQEVRKDLSLKKGELDLLAGCPPCQGFSKIGTNNQFDKRNDLVYSWLSYVKEFLPKSVMMENVPGPPTR